MRYKTIIILFVTLLVLSSSTGCMGITVPTLPKISPIVVPVQKPAVSFVESKDIITNPTNQPSGNITYTPTPTPTPTSRFIYV